MLKLDIIGMANTVITNGKVLKMFLIVETIIVSFLLLFSNKTQNVYHSEEIQLTDKIKVPKPVGEGQHRNFMVATKK